MTRPHLDQHPSGLPRRDPHPASAPPPGPGWTGQGDDWGPAWPTPGEPESGWPPASAWPQPGRPVPGYDGHTWYIDEDQHQAAPVEPLPVELAASVHLRRAALARMMRMNLLHARNAWEQRRQDPIAPHAVAWLFAQPDERPVYEGANRLIAAWRLWVDGPDARDLPHRLYRYHKALVEQLPTAGVVDLRTLGTGRDPQMRPNAVYVGLGVSSLDTLTGPWRQLLHDGTVTTLQTAAAIRNNVPETLPVDSDTDIPGTVRILLADGAVIVAERRGMCEYDQQIVWSTHSLSYPGQDQLYGWQPADRRSLDADATHGPVLEYLAPLHDLFMQLDQARLVAGSGSGSGQGGQRRPRGLA